MKDHLEPDIKLIEQAQSGSRDAQMEIWIAHRRWVAAIILAHRPRTVDVDDLMQDVALKLVTKISTLRDPKAFKPWLRQIAINICRGAARSLKPTLHFASGERDGDDMKDANRVGVPQQEGEPGIEQYDRAEAAKRLLQQVMTLPSEYREPLLLRSIRSMSYQQISRIMDLPVTTIETRLARARRMLREEIGHEILSEGRP